MLHFGDTSDHLESLESSLISFESVRFLPLELKKIFRTLRILLVFLFGWLDIVKIEYAENLQKSVTNRHLSRFFVLG